MTTELQIKTGSGIAPQQFRRDSRKTSAAEQLLARYRANELDLEELWQGLSEPEAFTDFVSSYGSAPSVRSLSQVLNLSRDAHIKLVKLKRMSDEAGAGPVVDAQSKKPDAAALEKPKTSKDKPTGHDLADDIRSSVELVTRSLELELSTGLPTWVVQRRKPPHDPGTLTFLKRMVHVFSHGETGHQQAWSVRFFLRATVACPLSTQAINALMGQMQERLGTEACRNAAEVVERQVRAQIDAVAASAPALAAKILGELRTALSDGVLYEQVAEAGNLRFMLSAKSQQELARAEAERARALLGLEDYPQAFPVARSLQRQIRFRVGPTNSGKTHDALVALAAARSGVYLAPLRLLAMEIRDRLVAEGIPCNLVTGEEKVLMEGARHTACTVEMLDTSHAVEVAVLDEIQMLQDPGRGWAWTYALVAAPAKELYVCGDPSMLGLCKKVVDSMGEAHETMELTRKTKLTVEPQPLQKLKGVQEGDAVVAFSRKDVLTLSARLRAQGLKVATLYGALAPEVRRAEATRFSSGEAEVVVATDVIGMGLNLPIRRVVFSTAHKFDGVGVRPLNATEVRQIAGRAGRFGKYPEGFVTALDAADLKIVRSTLQAQLPAPPKHLPLAPSRWHIEQLAELLNTNSICKLLEYFSTKVAVRSPLFKTAAMEDSIALGYIVDEVAPDLSLSEKYSFACAPVTRDKEEELDFFERSLRAHANGKVVRLPALPSWVGSHNAYHLEEAETLSKKLGIYAWLGFKFSSTFIDHAEVAERRSEVCRYIERALLTQGGFGVTSKERFDQRRSG